MSPTCPTEAATARHHGWGSHAEQMGLGIKYNGGQAARLAAAGIDPETAKTMAGAVRGGGGRKLRFRSDILSDRHHVQNILTL